MALPKIDVPTYEIELPVSKKKIKYRPFLVKEQRNLLMALESNDSPSIQNAVKDILNNCTLNDEINIDKLPIVDIEYYFIHLRAKSVGEVVESKYKCNNEVDGKMCGNIMESNLNLMDVEVTQSNSEAEIQLTPEIMVKMKYPEFSVVKESLNYETVNEVTFNMIARSIEYIYDGQQYHYAHETTVEQLMEWVEQLTQDQFEKIEEFFDGLPRLKKTLEMTCSKCGFHHVIPIEGLENFFV